MELKEAFNGFISDIKAKTTSKKTNDETAENSKKTVETSMKERVLTTWNNFKYDLSAGASINKESSVWLLGQHYYPKQANDSELGETGAYYHIREFIEDFACKPWFTYRKNFSPLNGSSLTSDTGWGCMLRSGQMILAEALLSHVKGRRYNCCGYDKLMVSRKHKEILSWFLDSPEQKHPFSIHNLIKLGVSYGNDAGSWYGPNTTAYILQDAVRFASLILPDLHDISVYVSQDCTVYEQDIIDECNWSDATQAGKSLIIFIPLRLGKSQLNPIYIPNLLFLFTNDQCIGVIGGTPNHSVYYVGCQDKNLFYLEPHYTQQCENIENGTFDVKNYHTPIVRKTNIKKLDPSCCVGFYCKNLDDFTQLKINLSQSMSPPNQKYNCPFCTFVDGRAEENCFYSKSEDSKCEVTSSDLKVKKLETDAACSSVNVASHHQEKTNTFSNFMKRFSPSLGRKNKKPSISSIDNDFEIL